MQKVLDPRIQTPGGQALVDYPPAWPASPKVACPVTFDRRCPDLGLLRLGDILLFSKNVVGGLDWVGQLIEAAQLGLRIPLEHAQWVHAAVYIGNGLCVEAVRILQPPRKGRRGGVIVNRASLANRLTTELVRVRRLSDDVLSMDPDAGIKLAAYSLDRTGHSYPGVPSLAAAAFPRIYRQVSQGARNVLNAFNTTHAGGAVHCSQLCGEAIADATGIDIFSHPLPPGQLPNLPYVLSDSDYLQDVDVGWAPAA